MSSLSGPVFFGLFFFAGACSVGGRVEDGALLRDVDVPYAARSETVADFATWLPFAAPTAVEPVVVVERVTAGVPWPRGLALVEDGLVVLARGRHRRAGGIDPAIADLSGSLMLVDPTIAEPVVPGVPASARTKGNARLFVSPDDAVFELYDPKVEPIQSHTVDRPYCTLAFDAASRNLFVCGFSGVDLPGAKFRKNATDSIHRFDLRTRSWHPVEMHDHRVVPVAELGYVVPNQYYPHHDVEENSPPHGWVNGPDACGVAGEYLYVAGKDNHVIARYDLAGIRKDPTSGPPASRLALGPHVTLRLPTGQERDVELLGPSAVTARDGFLYVGYRTSSVVVRYPVDASGELVVPVRGEIVAMFEPWRANRKRSANVIDIAFNSRGELFVACAKEARIWRVGVPDPSSPFFGDDRADRPTTASPYVDIREWTGKKAGCGNLVFDADDRLYFCVGNYDHGETLAGAVYRATLSTTEETSE